jgi:hypothetical protein
MIRSALTLVVILFLFHSEAESQKQVLLKKNVQDSWLIYTGREYTAFDESENPRTVYFQITPRAFRGDYLQIASAGDFSVFVNRQLFLEARDSTRIAIDSIPREYASEMSLISINLREQVTKENLITVIYSEIKNSGNEEGIFLQRKASYLKDFVITAVLFLFAFFILMIQLNPRLSLDYFSVAKIFSLRESEDDQYYLRITSANILFYAFTSLILALFILVANDFSFPTGLITLSTDSFGMVLLAWLKLSLIIFSFLFLKIILVFIISSLFDCRDSAGYHFFNFIRLLLIMTTLLTLILIGYYILNGTESIFYAFLFNSHSWILGLWIIILFFKLSSRVRFSPIHLFSYICATEILPFLIVIKILYE